MLPYFLNHYSKMVDKIVVYDNQSTDNSRHILESFKDCEIEIIDYDTDNQYSEESQTNVRNNCWKNDTESNYIIVVDIDEIIYHPKFREFLRNNRNIDCFKPVGYDMIGDDVPTDHSKQIYEIVKTGTLNTMYSKVALFRRKNILETNFTYGSHFSSFIGNKPLMVHESKGDLKNSATAHCANPQSARRELPVSLKNLITAWTAGQPSVDLHQTDASLCASPESTADTGCDR
jgi:hypothetical protein